ERSKLVVSMPRPGACCAPAAGAASVLAARATAPSDRTRERVEREVSAMTRCLLRGSPGRGAEAPGHCQPTRERPRALNESPPLALPPGRVTCTLGDHATARREDHHGETKVRAERLLETAIYGHDLDALERFYTGVLGL